jgi:hypothetical protein
VEKFEVAAAIDAQEKGFDRHGRKLPALITSNFQGRNCLRPDLARQVHRSDEWRQYEAELRAIAGFPSLGSNSPLEQERRRRELVKAFCRDRGLTMAALARQVPCDESAIYGMIRGDRDYYSPETLARFLKVIGVDPAEW